MAVVFNHYNMAHLWVMSHTSVRPALVIPTLTSKEKIPEIRKIYYNRGTHLCLVLKIEHTAEEIGKLFELKVNRCQVKPK